MAHAPGVDIRALRQRAQVESAVLLHIMVNQFYILHSPPGELKIFLVILHAKLFAHPLN